MADHVPSLWLRIGVDDTSFALSHRRQRVAVRAPADCVNGRAVK